MTTTYEEQQTYYVSIPQFYSGRSIFITGATGFLGKIFDTIRLENPTALNKVIAICGDITFDELGISKNDQMLLCKTVSIVFHSAATVRFDEKLKLAASINMVGTKRLVELCRRMMSLEALVYVSTAYANCDRSDVSEYVYETPFSADDIISLINWLPEDMLDELTPSLIGKRPNTYTFTKALTEQMLLQESINMPVVIVRPSIVGACLQEPVPGWVDSYTGSSSYVVGIGNGVIRTLMCKQKLSTDLVPVDIVINLLIVAAWKRVTTKSSELTVYNCVTSKQNPITLGKFYNDVKKYMCINPVEGIWWHPTIAFFERRELYLLAAFVVQFMPAYLIDLHAWTAGKRRIMVKMQYQAFEMTESTKLFLNYQWNFSDDNVRNLLTQMTQQDRESFQIDVSKIDWDEYMENYVRGVQKFMFKQSPTQRD